MGDSGTATTLTEQLRQTWAFVCHRRPVCELHHVGRTIRLECRGRPPYCLPIPISARSDAIWLLGRHSISGQQRAGITPPGLYTRSSTDTVLILPLRT